MLLPFFQWMEQLPFSVAIRESVWIGAVINVIHLLILVVLSGAVLIVDLRLLGRGTRHQPLAQVAREAQPWLIGALLGMAITGVPQVLSTAMKQYYSPFFWFKMECLLVTLIFTFTLRRQITLADEARIGPVWGKLVGLVSIGLWSGVAIPARLIGLLG